MITNEKLVLTSPLESSTISACTVFILLFNLNLQFRFVINYKSKKCLLFTDPLVLLVSKFESNYNTILAHSNSNVMENVGVIIIAIELT